jgi:hypothetical protein
VIDVTREKLIDLDAAAEICAVTVKTIRMWMGRQSRQLETVKLGGKRMTSREALQRFAQQDGEAGSAVVLPHGGPDPSDVARQMQERHGSF